MALACSGGADSTYLAWQWKNFLVELADQAPDTVIWVVDHGHRPETKEEAAAAAQIYRDLGFRVEILLPNPPKHHSGSPRSNPSAVNENDLRQLRYRAIAHQAKADGVSIVLTAHHADDQAETVLLRILRGTGMHGLSGMPATRSLADFDAPEVELRRPLLNCRAAQIRSDLQSAGIPWLEDPTNNQPEAATRNRLRHQVMPLLAQIATGDPTEAILKLSNDASQWRQWLQSTVLDPNSQSQPAHWRDLPQVLRQETIRHLVRPTGIPCTRTSLSNWEQSLLAKGHTNLNETHSLSTSGGRLHLKPRKYPKSRRPQSN